MHNEQRNKVCRTNLQDYLMSEGGEKNNANIEGCQMKLDYGVSVRVATLLNKAHLFQFSVLQKF